MYDQEKRFDRFVAARGFANLRWNSTARMYMG
jgi:hypothetical protein